MTKQDFDQELTKIKQHPLFNGNVFDTANLIEQAFNDSSANYVLSVGLYEDWIEEAAQ